MLVDALRRRDAQFIAEQHVPTTRQAVLDALREHPDHQGPCWLNELLRTAGFTQVRKAAETPFNVVLEARP